MPLRTKHNRQKNSWQIQEAKIHFFELVEAAEYDIQEITEQGEVVAFLLSKKEFEKLVKPKTTLIEFFENSSLAEIELDIDRVKESKMREVKL